jgi:hypothetical protein
MVWEEVKVRVNFTPNMPLKAQREVEGYSSTHSLTLALDGGGLSTPRPDRFIQRKKKRRPFQRKQGVPDGPL